MNCSKCGVLRQIGITDQTVQSFKLKTCDACRKRNQKYKQTHSGKQKIEPSSNFELFLQQISRGIKDAKIVMNIPEFLLPDIGAVQGFLKIQSCLKVHYINRILAVLEEAGSHFVVRSSNTKNSRFYTQYQCQDDCRSQTKKDAVECKSKLNLSYDAQSKEMCIDYSHTGHAVSKLTPFSVALGNAYSGGINSSCI